MTISLSKETLERPGLQQKQHICIFEHSSICIYLYLIRLSCVSRMGCSWHGHLEMTNSQFRLPYPNIWTSHKVYLKESRQSIFIPTLLISSCQKQTSEPRLNFSTLKLLKLQSGWISLSGVDVSCLDASVPRSSGFFRAHFLAKLCESLPSD